MVNDESVAVDVEKAYSVAVDGQGCEESSSSDRKRRRPIDLNVSVMPRASDIDLPFDSPGLTSTFGVKGSRRRRHARGNWPAHVWVALEPENHEHALAFEAATHSAVQQAESLLKKGFYDSQPAIVLTPNQPTEPPPRTIPEIYTHRHATAQGSTDPSPEFAHLSLSRPFSLRRHEIDQMVTALRDACSLLDPFHISFGMSSWCLLPSEDQDRTFLALNVLEGCEELDNLVCEIDKVMGRFGKPTYYEERHFHITVAYMDIAMSSKSLEPLQGHMVGVRVKEQSRAICSLNYGGSELMVSSHLYTDTLPDETLDQGPGDDEGAEMWEFKISSLEFKAGHRRFAARFCDE